MRAPATGRGKSVPYISRRHIPDNQKSSDQISLVAAFLVVTLLCDAQTGLLAKAQLLVLLDRNSCQHGANIAVFVWNVRPWSPDHRRWPQGRIAPRCRRRRHEETIAVRLKEGPILTGNHITVGADQIASTFCGQVEAERRLSFRLGSPGQAGQWNHIRVG